MALAEERGRLAGELKEAGEALQAADAATQALSSVRDRLDSASGWSTYDTFFGGGAMASVVKHERMDEAARAAAGRTSAWPCCGPSSPTSGNRD